MEKVTVKRAELLEKLKANRDSHAQLYKDALEGYLKIAKERLEKALKKVEAGDTVALVRLEVPKDHTDMYDEAIALLEMSVDNEIELTRYEFNNYVLDKWINDSEKHMLRGMALSSANFANYK